MTNYTTRPTTGCKKDIRNNDSYYIQADLNGITESFNNDNYAQEFSGDITASFSVNGKSATLQHQLVISIGHVFGRIIRPGTYDKQRIDSLYLPGLAYSKNDSIFYGSGVRPENPFPVGITVSALTSATVSGIFYGIVYNPQNPADSIVITNGKFFVPFK